MPEQKQAVVLLNLGSPLSPAVRDVRTYLHQFLNDPYVIDIPTPLRRLLVSAILINRPQKTSEAYQQVWTAEGSPLVFHTRNLTQKVAALQSRPVVFCMRYGEPSIERTLRELFQNHPHLNEIIFIPLYPQYSFAATESAIVEFDHWIKKIAPQTKVKTIEDFYNDPLFIEALTDSIRPAWQSQNADLLLLSYHGIPERQIPKAKEGKDYRAQCYETSRLLAARLGIRHDQYFVSFQSRLGRTKWIEPYTDLILADLPKKGVKRLLVASPSFTADCLETLEEIQIRYRELFIDAGGEFFEYIPCVNSSDAFAHAIQEWIHK